MLKGPAIGPLIICGVCFLDSKLSYLSKIGVKDSKKLTAKKRKDLSEKIRSECHSYELIIITVQEIDNREKLNLTLNRLEELKMAEILNKLKPDEIYIDAVDVNEKRFGQSMKNLLNFTPNKLISKHKADDIYPIVSAASIIAKHERDSMMVELNKKYGNMGSGYPSDKRTTDFMRKWIRENKSIPGFIRRSWETTKKIFEEEVENKKITDFFR
ncbi:MAG: ribonuclease HII [Promethearchaeota archaeon]|nr:MAG: ribonuclease HII [Candidatus Lokiarchaeota archaeon]